MPGTDVAPLYKKTPSGYVYKALRDLKTILDTSGFPKDHPFFTYDITPAEQAELFKLRDDNRKRLGTLGFEWDCPATQFTALAPKNYGLVFNDGSEKIKAKGVTMRLSDIKVEAMRRLLIGREKVQLLTNQTQIVSHPRNFSMRLRTFKKRAMNVLDTKRYILPDGIHTLPYGHCDIPIHDDAAACVDDMITAVENDCVDDMITAIENAK